MEDETFIERLEIVTPSDKLPVCSAFRHEMKAANKMHNHDSPNRLSTLVVASDAAAAAVAAAVVVVVAVVAITIYFLYLP